MKERRSRIVKAWVLLSVFVSMMALACLHRHESAAALTADCAACAHHIDHSHLTVSTPGLHDCLLCQFITLNYVAAATIVLAAPTIAARVRTGLRHCAPCNGHGGYQSSRAPPHFG